MGAKIRRSAENQSRFAQTIDNTGHLFRREYTLTVGISQKPQVAGQFGMVVDPPFQLTNGASGLNTGAVKDSQFAQAIGTKVE